MDYPHEEKIILFNPKPKESIKDEIKESLFEIEKEREIKAKRKRQHKSSNANQDRSVAQTPPHTIFNIKSNSGNVIGSVGDNAIFYSETTRVIKSPPPDTIGAHGHLVKILNDKIKELAETRARDFAKQGKDATIGSIYQAINRGFRKFMQLPSWDTRKAITIIKERNINEFDTIQNYFNEKLSQTVTGKIKGAMEKRTSGTSFYLLMSREKELLGKIGLKPDSPEVYAALKRYFGVSSHKNLQPFKHKGWISYIESIVDKVERGILAPSDIKL